MIAAAFLFKGQYYSSFSLPSSLFLLTMSIIKELNGADSDNEDDPSAHRNEKEE